MSTAVAVPRGHRPSPSADRALFEMLGIYPEDAAAATEETPLPPLPLPPPSDLSPRLPARAHRRSVPPRRCVAFLLPGLLTPDECSALIATGSASGFRYVTTARDADGGVVSLPMPNPHKLSAFTPGPLASDLFGRIVRRAAGASHLRIRGGEAAVGINPRFRVLRYDAADSDRFEPHYDAVTEISGRSSRLTVLVYLNSGRGIDFDGGETVFLNPTLGVPGEGGITEGVGDDALTVVPEAGCAVVFEHDLHHAGRGPRWGTKYVLRTDLMFDGTNTGDGVSGAAPAGPPPPPPPPRLATLADLLVPSLGSAGAVPDDLAALLQSAADFGLSDVSVESFTGAGRSMCLEMAAECVEAARPGLGADGVVGAREAARRWVDAAFKEVGR